MRTPLTIELLGDSAPFDAAIASLKHFLKISPQIVKRFLDGIDDAAQLLRIDSDSAPACWTNQLRITFRPSDIFCNFLAACVAGDIAELVRETSRGSRDESDISGISV